MPATPPASAAMRGSCRTATAAAVSHLRCIWPPLLLGTVLCISGQTCHQATCCCPGSSRTTMAAAASPQASTAVSRAMAGRRSPSACQPPRASPLMRAVRPLMPGRTRCLRALERCPWGWAPRGRLAAPLLQRRRCRCADKCGGHPAHGDSSMPPRRRSWQLSRAAYTWCLGRWSPRDPSRLVSRRLAAA